MDKISEKGIETKAFGILLNLSWQIKVWIASNYML